MDGTFVATLRESMQKPTILTVRGKERAVVPSGWQDVTPKQPEPAPLKTNTLTGLVDYLKANVDGLALASCLVHVLDPNTVWVEDKLEDEANDFRRRKYVVATTEMVGKGFAFCQYLDAESFFVGLQSLFVQTEQRDEILKLVAGIKESTVRETVDTGVAQQVNVATGVHLVGMTKVPNPVILVPYRTFREVPQPQSLFILRLLSGKEGEKPRCALLEADGGTWKLEAVQLIATYLRDKLGEAPAVIA